MTADQKELGWGFWLQWVLATTIGFVIGGMVSGSLVFATETRFAGVSSAVAGALAMAAAQAVAFGLHGAALGSAQWFVLRNAIARPGTWILATAGGWAAAGILSGTVSGAFGGALTGVGPDYGNIGRVIAFSSGFASLLLPGLVQWLALRGQVSRPGWWALANAPSMLAAIAVAFPAMLVASGALGWDLPSAQAWGFAGVLAGAIYGAITGAVMVWLLRQPQLGSSAGMPPQATV